MSDRYTLTVNGKKYITTEEKPLLRYLRDDLGLKSVKDGCSEGACGTCTVVVDGKAVKSCVLTTKRAQNKQILTVEGLSEREKEIFVYAFGAAGAVQCGFCTPGMVMCAKALLDQDPDPDEEQIKKALRGNLCRCTGYKKIVEAEALWYNAARIESILLCWEGGTPVNIKVFRTPAGSGTAEQTELLLTKSIPDGDASVLLDADILHDGGVNSHFFFELDFGTQVVKSEEYNLLYDENG